MSRVLKTPRWFYAFVFAALSQQLLAADFDKEFDEKSWVEIEVQLPSFPEKGNLIPFRVGAISDTKYLIDGNSLSVGADGVIRYALVVVSSEGAQNISYEGMRCATAERRFYAFGRSDQTWSKARNNQWVKIQGSSNSHHVELYFNHFCSAGIVSVRNAEDARRVLRNGVIPLR